MSGLALAFFALLGAIIGSFAGVIAERLHTGESWMRGRSRCNSCAIELRAPDLVPVLSWLFLAGRCRSCGSRVSALYVVVELVLALVFALGFAKLGLTLPLLWFLVFVFVLAVVVLYDLRHTVVPRIASLFLIVLSLLFAYSSSVDFTEFAGILMVAGIIGLGFLLLYVLSMGRAMGLGDAPVAFSLALIAGHDALSGLLFSFWIGAIVGIAILVTRPKGHRMGIEVPFVPFLAAGFLLAFFTSWNPLGLVIGY